VVDNVGNVKTGYEPLDEKLSGGFDRGANILLFGPPIAGKRVFARMFILTGLKSGEACIMSCTNSTAEEESRTFRRLGVDIGEFEEKGLLVYLDFHSRLIGASVTDKPFIRRIPSIIDLASFNVALREVLTEFHRKGLPIRLVFDSISTVMLYNPFQTVSRFLHVTLGRLKSLGSTSLLLLDEGAHSPSDIVTIKGMVDAVVTIKTRNGSRYLKYESEIHNVDWMLYEVRR